MTAFWLSIQDGKEPPPDTDLDIYIPSGADLDRWTELAGKYRKVAVDKAKLDAQVKKLGGPGATVPRVCLQPGSAVVAAFRRRHPPATRPSLHPGPGKPPLTPIRPPPRWRPRPRPPRRRPRGACQAPPGDATLGPASAARAVELPIL